MFMLKAVRYTAEGTNLKISKIKHLISQTVDYVKIKLPKIYSRELIDVIFEQPYCKIQNLVLAKIAKRQTASVYLKKLCDIGVLEERTISKEKLFIHPKLMQVLQSDNADFSNYNKS